MKTDSQLQQDVQAELAWEPAVHAAHIGVEVKDGVVTLAGDVDAYSEKWNAEGAAQRVPGVKALASALKVRLPGPSQRDDADIARSVKNVLEWTAALPAGAVQVMVEAGWVTLSGEVDWHFQKQAATDSVRHLMGVVGVSDQIGLKPVLPSATIRADIAGALQRSAIADAQGITVDVSGGTVTLGGGVRGWSERELAHNAAWGTAGVRQVVDHMSLRA